MKVIDGRHSDSNKFLIIFVFLHKMLDSTLLTFVHAYNCDLFRFVVSAYQVPEQQCSVWLTNLSQMDASIATDLLGDLSTLTFHITKENHVGCDI